MELSSAHRCSQAKCQFIKIFLVGAKNMLFVWENLDLGRVYRPHCVRSVLTTSVKILPYRPPARLIRAKNMLFHSKCIVNAIVYNLSFEYTLMSMRCCDCI